MVTGSPREVVGACKQHSAAGRRSERNRKKNKKRRSDVTKPTCTYFKPTDTVHAKPPQNLTLCLPPPLLFPPFDRSDLCSQEHRLGRWDFVREARNGSRVFNLSADALTAVKPAPEAAATAIAEDAAAEPALNGNGAHSAAATA